MTKRPVLTLVYRACEGNLVSIFECPDNGYRHDAKHHDTDDDNRSGSIDDVSQIRAGHQCASLFGLNIVSETR